MSADHSSILCRFCSRDPFHYVDIGVGMEPVAVVCCEEAISEYYQSLTEADKLLGQNNLIRDDNSPW